MDRKPVWINGRQVFVLPWARVWDVLMALPADDFRAVWTARAHLVDVDGGRISPDDIVYSGQKISIFRTGTPSRTDVKTPPPSPSSAGISRNSSS